MKLIRLLPVAAVASAMVVPDEEMTTRLVQQSENHVRPITDKLPSPESVLDQIKDKFSGAVEASNNALDDALSVAAETRDHAKERYKCYKSMTAFDAQSWLETQAEKIPSAASLKAAFPKVDFDDDAATLGHGHHGHHGHHKPNRTVYQLIAESKYTTKLAKLISDDEDLVKLLNGTSANFTVFAPTDAAFEKLPDHGKKPSKELIKKVLTYHVSDEFYPAGRVLASHTIPSLLEEPDLGNERQRLRVGLTLKGLTANFYSRIVAINIFGTNGVIHGVDSLILPPPDVLKIVDLVPGYFSTLELGLVKTGLANALADAPHEGGTLFAPSNSAFQKLGPRINAFLFSKYGRKYLKALLEYHVVANQTLYSDAFYKSDEASVEGVPKGVYHVDLPTLLKDRHLSVDVARYGGLINIRINGYVNVGVQDGIAKDGVIQIVSNVLIPPKQVDSDDWTEADDDVLMFDDVEGLKARLEPFVSSHMQDYEDWEESQEL